MEKIFSEVLTPDREGARQSAGLFRLRAEFAARRGHWNEALADATRSLELNITNSQTWLELAPLLAQSNPTNYNRHCEAMLARLGATDDPAIARQTLHACLLLPATNMDLTAMVALGERSLMETNGFSELTKALFELRAGRYAAALEWSQKCLARSPLGQRDAQAFLVIAMAQHQLNRPADANMAFNKGVEIVEKNLPKLDSGDLGQDWAEVISAQILLREARTLIEGDAISSSTAGK